MSTDYTLRLVIDSVGMPQTVAAVDNVTHAIERGTKAHEPHIHNLSRIGNGLAALVGHATGVPPIFERIGDSIAIFAFGHLATVGVLAGFAAIAYAYEKMGEKAREAAKEMDKAVESLLEWKKEQDFGIGGKFAGNLEESEKRLQMERDHLAALKKILDRPATAQVFGEGVDQSQEGAESERAKIQARYDKLAKAVEAGEAHIEDLKRKASDHSAATDIHNLATLITAHKANAGEVRNATALLTGLRQSLTALAGDGSQTAQRAVLIDQIKELNDALNPEDKLGAQQLAERIKQGLDAYTHFVHEQQAAYKQASEETVKEFERAQDEETSIGLAQAKERAANEQRVYKEEGERALREIEGSKARASGMDLGGLRDAIHRSLEEGGVLMEDAVQALAARMNQALSKILGDGIAAGFEEAFRADGFQNPFAAFAKAVLSGLGSFMEQLGAQMIVVGIALDAFASALLSLNGPGAILAGVALVAAGAGLKAIAGSFGRANTTAGTPGYTGAPTPSFLSFGVRAASPPTTSLGAPSARATNNWTIIGPDDPKAQRAIADLVNAADRRGLVSIGGA